MAAKQSQSDQGELGQTKDQAGADPVKDQAGADPAELGKGKGGKAEEPQRRRGSLEVPDGMVVATFVVTSLQHGVGRRDVVPVDDDDAAAQGQVEEYDTTTATLEPARRSADVEGFNSRLWQQQPRGQLVLGKMIAEAASQLKVGQAYHLALQPVPDEGERR